jgi:carbonic anhydrase/acetyltransferase-like protein (isoleucine patch superfamily)
MALWALGDAVPRIDQNAWVHPAAQLIGHVVVRAGASIWPGAVLRADFGWIDVDEGSSVQDNCVLHPGSRMPVQIGRDCIVGHAVHLEGAVIEDAVLIGSDSILPDGARVRTGAIVAAGALLLRGTEVHPGQRAQGVPAKLVVHEGSSARVRQGAHNYRRLARRYMDELRPVEAVAR